MDNYIYSAKQELIYGLIHGAGLVFGVSGLPVLIGIATAHNNVPGIIGAGIYGFSFLLLFTCSMVYHLASEPVVKRIFEILDHIGIYFLISGTYTPFLLVYIHTTFGLTLLSILWGLTVAGIFFKIWFTGRFQIISTIIYVLMGGLMVVGGGRFFEHLPSNVIIMIFTGGALYLIGVGFYVWGKWLYNHAIWHGLILAAAICNYVAVLFAM
jgi:hemolysin III